jgi:hypothetical protein
MCSLRRCRDTAPHPIFWLISAMLIVMIVAMLALIVVTFTG